MNTDLDLVVTRVIAAPRAAVWAAWTTPSSFEKWWVPAPTQCRVIEMDLTPGGSFVTEMSDNGTDFGPQISGCFLALDEHERIVFTTALVAGWRPAEQPFITAIITLAEHPDGTLYTARAMHKDLTDKRMHEELGFFDGWGTVTRQLAELVEGS
jgi:uncharacterized protein YndB with AHSA1/START domain